jgi:hypothetical protein
MERSLEQVIRDQENQAKTITEIIQNQRSMNDDLVDVQRANAVRAEADKHRDEKLDSIFNLGRTILVAVILLFIGAVFAGLRAGIFNV